MTNNADNDISSGYRHLREATGRTFEEAVKWLKLEDEGEERHSKSRKHAVRAAWELLKTEDPDEIAREVYNRCEKSEHQTILGVLPETQRSDVQRALSELETGPPDGETDRQEDAVLCISDLGEELCKGGFAKVYGLPGDQERVAKVLEAGGDETRFRREYEILQHLAGHDGIVEVYDMKESHDDVPQSYIVMQRAPGDVPKKTLPLLQIARMMAKVANTLHHAHKHSIVHRDVSPNNILYCEKSHTAKLVDWGVSVRKGDNENTEFEAKTKGFEAPDGIRNKPAGDVYSCGRIIRVFVDQHKEKSTRLGATLLKIADRCLVDNSSKTGPLGAISNARALERALRRAIAEEWPWLRIARRLWRNTQFWRAAAFLLLLTLVATWSLAFWRSAPNGSSREPTEDDAIEHVQPSELAKWAPKPRRVLLERWELTARQSHQRGKYQSARDQFQDVIEGCGAPESLPVATAKLRANALLELAIIDHTKLINHDLAEQEYGSALQAWRDLLPPTLRDRVSNAFSEPPATEWLDEADSSLDIETLAGLARCYGYMGDLHFWKENGALSKDCYEASVALRKRVYESFNNKDPSLASLSARLELYRGQENQLRADWWNERRSKAKIGEEVDAMLKNRNQLCDDIQLALGRTTDSIHRSQIEELLRRARSDTLRTCFMLEAGAWHRKTSTDLIHIHSTDAPSQNDGDSPAELVGRHIDGLTDEAQLLAHCERDLLLSRGNDEEQRSALLKAVYGDIKSYWEEQGAQPMTRDATLVFVRVAGEYKLSLDKESTERAEVLQRMHQVVDPLRPEADQGQSPPKNDNLPRVFRALVNFVDEKSG